MRHKNDLNHPSFSKVPNPTNHLIQLGQTKHKMQLHQSIKQNPPKRRRPIFFMRVLFFTLFFLNESLIFAGQPKKNEFSDVVYKVQSEQDKVLVSFRLHASIYEFPTSGKNNSEQLKKLQESQKFQKSLVVVVDPLAQRIVEVKGH